ncbi:MAG: hypothetical protein CMN78_01260 [Spirochaetales bacterium]|nr:hypothetical protein [Spirochaetales bacterium]
MSGKRRCAIILIAVCIGTITNGQEIDPEGAPTWLIFEKGKQLFDSGEFGESLLFFRTARGRRSPFPEVEYWIGRVFEAEGELSLAERQYLAALEIAQYLETPDDEFVIRYQLANLYIITHRYSKYEQSLDDIIGLERSRRKSASIIDIDPQLLVETLLGRGLDKLLELYRLDDYGGVEAYFRSGVYRYRRGFFNRAAEDLIYGIVITSTNILDYLLDRDPEYRFSTIESMIVDITRHRALVDYAQSMGFFGQIYALGLSLHDSQDARRINLARDMWRVISGYGPKGSPWVVKSRLQLASPFADQLGIIFTD